ncbi:GGDEF domain-containing protein [Algoriphagus aquimarinus]|uniref:diguanylate cyclase n=1 Tax=Algoriphagus aquimarinus TaxID=237018 RepID=A0A5C7AXR5_9BACT|nr:GGDEF domain-containing protein [Algoriphagus aquimarinus]TXE13468.1 GGDEF domain-containing protein [Algoriphagus aquimarinus]
MIENLKQSFKKFKADALSKVFYDVMKWIVIGLTGLIITDLLPIGTIKDFFQGTVLFTNFQVIFSCLLLILSSVVFVSLFYNRNYRIFKEQNQIDELTGLKNHKALEEYIEDRLQYYRKNGGSMSIILMDIDDFKNFNTKYGYNTADRILGKVGEFLGSDKRATDETFRKFSRGDEFVIITNNTSLSGAVQAAERKRIFIESISFMVEKTSYNLTVSCGVTALKPLEDDYLSLTDRVNNALLEAKNLKGKNCTRSTI